MNKVQDCYQINSAERNIICELVYEAMKKMEDNDGNISHLTVVQRRKYELLKCIYQAL